MEKLGVALSVWAAALVVVTAPMEVTVELNRKTILCPLPMVRGSTSTSPVIGTTVVGRKSCGPVAPCTFRDCTHSKASAPAPAGGDITNSVMLYAGNVAVMLFAATFMSGNRTIAPAFAPDT